MRVYGTSQLFQADQSKLHLSAQCSFFAKPSACEAHSLTAHLWTVKDLIFIELLYVKPGAPKVTHMGLKSRTLYIYTSKIYAAACIAEPKFHDLFSESDEDDSSSPRKLPYMAMQEGPCIYSLPNLINLEGPCYGRHTTLIEKVGCFTISMHGEGHSSSAT